MGSSRPIPEALIDRFGPPSPAPKAPSIFCGGNEFFRRAAGITITPVYPPEHFEPQNYPRITQPEQGEQ